jgi:phosphatidate cytidylyltransferase
MGLVLALVTGFGDLFISMLKRAAGVKDSGTLIPGHGCILDRADTWLWGMMLGYYLVLVFV